MPGSVLMTILASASSAPVLPAVTTPEASPLATASIATRIDEPRMRSAAVGFMSLPITSGAWRIVQAAAARRMALRAAAQLGLVADQQEPRARVAFGGDLQSLDDHERRVIAAHGVHRQRVGRGQGRT